ncbi:hypothetical protein BDP27DRAFT_1426711 [Rhodocollybia butyracea]|uniref:Uncharacterized protein n=1 Tax=Rhodocollybia butyracea TaxID=206335 RepID=A0A9P5PHT0_9AGAR|nr:hypothetical protein BDP27DRAFT_1426711 [Rhodocollybia butyracea]
MSDIPMNSSQQRKRARGQSAEPDSSSTPLKKARRSATSTPDQTKKGKREWTVPSSQIPKKAQGLKRALDLHIRILWRLFTQDDVPPPVAGTIIENFQERFKSSDDIRAHIDDLISAAIPPSRDAQDAVADCCCKRWAPDVLGTVESMYNALHEHLALSTFKVIAASFGYTFMNVDLSFLQNHGFLVKLYRSFVFGHMADKARRESKTPGRVASDNLMVNVYKRRNKTRETRVKQLRDDGFNPAVVRLAQQNEAHSDDERDPNSAPDHDRYLIHEKEGRSTLVTALFRETDERYRKAFQRRTGTRVDRTRFVPDVPIGDSKITRYPNDVPIDYFEPEYFNQMSVRERATYMQNGIALPKPEFCNTSAEISAWKNLPEDEFMDKYGNAKLALYNIPTRAELEQLDEYDEEENYDDNE